MDQEATTPDSAPEVSDGITEDQAASELLKRWGKPEGSSTEGETPDEPADEEVPEGTTAESDAEVGDDEPEESDEIEIDVVGEKFKLPKVVAEQAKRIEAKAKEVEAGAQRKFQEAAEVRRVVDARERQVANLEKFAHDNAGFLADHRWVTNKLAQYEQLDVGRLSQEDPQLLTRINAEVMQLRTVKERIEQAIGHAAKKSDETRQAMHLERLQKLDEFASKAIKDWSTDRGKRLTSYALGKGMSQETLVASLSPEFLLMLDDAEYGARVRSAKPRPSQAPQKTLKPGATASTKSSSALRVQQANQRLKSSGSVQDAARALLARSSQRK